jgi:hypothetical protein
MCQRTLLVNPQTAKQTCLIKNVDLWSAAARPTLRARIGIDVARQFCRNRRMMNTRIAAVTVVLLFVAATACFAANPYIGTWKLNEAKSKLVPGMGKNTTVTWAEQKDKFKVTVEGVDKDGKPTHSVWIGKLDGKAYPVKGNLPYNSFAYKVVNDRTYHLTAMKDGKMLWTGKSAVSADGKSRTVTLNGTDASGKKFSGKVVYDKE